MKGADLAPWRRKLAWHAPAEFTEGLSVAANWRLPLHCHLFESIRESVEEGKGSATVGLGKLKSDCGLWNALRWLLFDECVLLREPTDAQRYLHTIFVPKRIRRTTEVCGLAPPVLRQFDALQ